MNIPITSGIFYKAIHINNLGIFYREAGPAALVNDFEKIMIH